MSRWADVDVRTSFCTRDWISFLEARREEITAFLQIGIQTTMSGLGKTYCTLILLCLEECIIVLYLCTL